MVNPNAGAQPSPIEQAQEFLRAGNLDAWLVYDHRGMNPALADIVSLDGYFTRPVFLLLPPDGAPTLFASAVDAGQFRSNDAALSVYRGRDDLHAMLRKALRPFRRVAMEYSPNRELPLAGRVDAGTVELVRSFGVEIASSAELLQYATQRWSEAGLASHRRAADTIAGIVLDAFAFIGDRLASGVTEHDAAQYIMDRFASAGLVTDHGPVVAANAHASDPHFNPTPEASSAFRLGDLALIDLWAREPGPNGVYADITWVASIGREAPAEQRRVFEVVAGARDVAAEFLAERLSSGENAQGWEADRAARNHIAAAGYGDYFVHRLGHSLGKQVHAGGVNLDSLETRDTRTFLPQLGFTIEPGVYLPQFGVRSEIDLYVGPAGLEVTTPVQREIVLIT